MAALLWNNNNRLGYSAKSGDERGLTDYGWIIVREMERLHMAVDVSHLNEGGFYDLFDKGGKPPMASHSCCRAMCDHCRNLTDEQIRLMISGGGYIGVNFYPHFLADNGKADAALVARHIDRICQMGGAEYVGFGSDFDGIECTPDDLSDASQMGNLLNELRKLGYSEAAIERIAGENLRSYFRRLV